MTITSTDVRAAVALTVCEDGHVLAHEATGELVVVVPCPACRRDTSASGRYCPWCGGPLTGAGVWRG